jgi:HK97 family phage portal protein
MSIFDRFRKKEFNPNLFSFLFGQQAPDMKGNEYLRAYKSWVYTCVNAIAEEVANIDLRLMKWTSKGNIEIYDHIALDLLKNVNNFSTSSMLFLGTQSYLELSGNTYWYLPKGNVTQKPAEIWLLDPTRMTVVRDSTEVISGYVYMNEKGAKIPVDVDEILHFKRFNPLDRYYGMGTVQAAAMAIDIDNYSAQWNKNFFYNSAVPSAVLETPEEITDEEYNRLKANWESKYQGLDNAHRLAILQGGMTYKPMNMTQKEMDFLEQRKFTRDEIMAMFRVPKTILGITDDVNRANAEASEYVFAKRVVQPRMQFLVDHLNEFYLPLFKVDPNTMWFEFDDPVPENVELDITYKGSGIRDGWLTPNEAREMEGLSPVENGDSVFMSALYTPLGQAIDETKTYDVKTKQFSPERMKAVNSRVRWLNNEIKRRTVKFSTIYKKVGEDIGNAIKTEAKSLVKGKVDDWLRIGLGALGTMDAYFGEEITDTHKTSLERAATQQLLRLASEVTFDLENPRAIDYIQTRGLFAVKSIDGTVKEKAKEIISRGVAEGLGPDETAKLLTQFYTENANVMATRLARTELVSAYSEGNLEAGLLDDNVVSKRWLALPDADEECLINEHDGEIPKDAGFSSGDFAPPVHPNCRCDVEYLTGTEKSIIYQRAIKKVEAHIDKKAEEIKANLEEEKIKAKKEAETILNNAKEDAVKIINEAKEKGEVEKIGLIKDLKTLKDKAIKQIYGK